MFSFHVSGTPGRHQCNQSWTPSVALIILPWYMPLVSQTWQGSYIHKLDPSSSHCTLGITILRMVDLRWMPLPLAKGFVLSQLPPMFHQWPYTSLIETSAFLKNHPHKQWFYPAFWNISKLVFPYWLKDVGQTVQHKPSPNSSDIGYGHVPSQELRSLKLWHFTSFRLPSKFFICKICSLG